MTISLSQRYAGDTGPYSAVVPITKHDTDLLPDGVCRGILSTTAGTVSIIDGSGVTRTGVPLVAGFNPIKVQAVLTAGTATTLWALY